MLLELRHWLYNDTELKQMRKALPDAAMLRNCSMKK
jgi:hypothetical protein